jgi:hypothetical protein
MLFIAIRRERQGKIFIKVRVIYWRDKCFLKVERCWMKTKRRRISLALHAKTGQRNKQKLHFDSFLVFFAVELIPALSLGMRGNLLQF